MKFSNVLGFLAIGAVSAAPAEDRSALDLTHIEAKTNHLEARANLPGLNAVQSKYARAIIAKAKADGVGAHGCQAGIATALVEVSLSPRYARTSLFLFLASLDVTVEFPRHFCILAPLDVTVKLQLSLYPHLTPLLASLVVQ